MWKEITIKEYSNLFSSRVEELTLIGTKQKLGKKDSNGACSIVSMLTMWGIKKGMVFYIKAEIKNDKATYFQYFPKEKDNG
jgi:hypothetical protein